MGVLNVFYTSLTLPISVLASFLGTRAKVLYLACRMLTAPQWHLSRRQDARVASKMSTPRCICQCNFLDCRKPVPGRASAPVLLLGPMIKGEVTLSGSGLIRQALSQQTFLLLALEEQSRVCCGWLGGKLLGGHML